jgi:RES domain
VSSAIWTPHAVASSATRFAGEAWRAVEAQHIASTMALVDSVAEQHVLETVLDDGKPPVPAGAHRLHYLLFTPFRYAPPPGGSRFRGEIDPGVFYAADEMRTACAELGYWRWRHLLDTPALSAMPARAQTVFRVSLDAPAIDLRTPPFATERSRWTDPNDYGACQTFARAAREATIGVIRYESVRDPLHGGCCAVLDPGAFARRAPGTQQTWVLSVFRERVVWQRSHVSGGGVFEFLASAWTTARAPARRRVGPRSGRIKKDSGS